MSSNASTVCLGKPHFSEHNSKQKRQKMRIYLLTSSSSLKIAATESVFGARVGVGSLGF